MDPLVDQRCRASAPGLLRVRLLWSAFLRLTPQYEPNLRNSDDNHQHRPRLRRQSQHGARGQRRARHARAARRYERSQSTGELDTRVVRAARAN